VKRRVLLLSSDPAHSVGDVFMFKAGDEPLAVPGGPRNLRIRELDAAAALAVRRSELQAAVDEIVAAFGVESIADGAGMSRLLDLAPPGIDELFGVLSVVDVQDQYDTVVVDTAPTGHALRLLEMPDVAREWIQAFLRVLLKYRELVRPGLLAASLVDVSRSVRRLQQLLRDPSVTRFIVVTRAAEVPRLETERLLRRLRRLGLATPTVVVNARTLAPGACRWCRAVAAAERQEMARLAAAGRGRRGGRVIIQTPLTVPPPRGVAALERWGRAWML
jgi:arsenite-transporting ATPase